MKRTMCLSFFLLALVLVGCSSSTKSSTQIPLDFKGEVMISNGDFDVTIYEVEALEFKKMVDRTLSLNETGKAQYTLYEIRMRYTNLTDKESILSYRRLWVSLPELEDPGDQLSVVGYCEAEAENPTGDPTWCGYIPPSPEPGKYGVVGVFHTPSPRIQPGEEGKLNLIILVDNAQSEIEISFIELE